MKKRIYSYLTALFCLLNPCVYSQADSARSSELLVSETYFGLSSGLCKSGIGVAFNGTFIFTNNWGGTVSYNANILTARNLPDDYYDFVLFIPFLLNGLPTDNIQALSFNLLRAFPTQIKLIRFGIEFGPSIVNTKIAHFTPIPGPIPFFGTNYDMTRDNNYSIGLSLRGKAEFLFSRFAGIEMAGYTNINSIRPIIGFELGINFGLVREK
jgi:hypothetical protein